MNLFPIETEIVNELQAVTRKHWQHDDAKFWTNIIEKALVDLGKRHDYRVYTSGHIKGSAGGEWLFDLCWIDETNDWREFRGLKLACEIEWNSSEDAVLEDFQKLTVCLADYRLIVVNHYSDKATAKFAEACKAQCPGSRGFRYLMVGVPMREPPTLKVETWTLYS